MRGKQMRSEHGVQPVAEPAEKWITFAANGRRNRFYRPARANRDQRGNSAEARLRDRHGWQVLIPFQSKQRLKAAIEPPENLLSHRTLAPHQFHLAANQSNH